jgi:hypothetical protein
VARPLPGRRRRLLSGGTARGRCVVGSALRGGLIRGGLGGFRQSDAGAEARRLSRRDRRCGCACSTRERVLGPEGGGGALVRPRGLAAAAGRPGQEAALARQPRETVRDRGNRPWAGGRARPLAGRRRRGGGVALAQFARTPGVELVHAHGAARAAVPEAAVRRTARGSGGGRSCLCVPARHRSVVFRGSRPRARGRQRGDRAPRDRGARASARGRRPGRGFRPRADAGRPGADRPTREVARLGARSGDCRDRPPW